MKSRKKRDISLSDHISDIALELQRTLLPLIGASVQQPPQPGDIASAFGLNRVFCHKLAGALRRVDPLATLHQIPGPEPLRRLLDLAAKDESKRAQVEAARAAIEAFESLIRKVAGDRSGLDAIISRSLPEARARFESDAKQSVFRGMRQLIGIAVETHFCTAIIHPSQDNAERHDFVTIHGYFGVRRIRPDASFNLNITIGADAPSAIPRLLDGRPVEENRQGVILKQFCHPPPRDVTIKTVGNEIVYTLDWGDEVGLPSGRDFVMAELRRQGPRRFRNSTDTRTMTGTTSEIEVPTQLFIEDLLMHHDVYPDWNPEVRILQTGSRGYADPNDPIRELDVIDVQESIEPLGSDLGRCRIESVPNYVDLLQHVFAQTGWKPSEFRGYRTRIDHPIFGSQIQHRFHLPLRG